MIANSEANSATCLSPGGTTDMFDCLGSPAIDPTCLSSKSAHCIAAVLLFDGSSRHNGWVISMHRFSLKGNGL
jgi:hypothetical protein